MESKIVGPFDVISAGLEKLKGEVAIIPDAKTPAGYKELSVNLRRVVKIRTGLDKERLKLTKGLRDEQAKINAEAKRITAILVEIESPMAAVKKDIDEAAAKIKAARIAETQEKIGEIRSAVEAGKGKTSSFIENLIVTIDAVDTETGFYELTGEAVQARTDTLIELNRMLSERLSFESAEIERKKADEARHKIEELARIDREDAAQKEASAAQEIKDLKAQLAEQVKKIQANQKKEEERRLAVLADREGKGKAKEGEAENKTATEILERKLKEAFKEHVAKDFLKEHDDRVIEGLAGVDPNKWEQDLKQISREVEGSQVIVPDYGHHGFTEPSDETFAGQHCPESSISTMVDTDQKFNFLNMYFDGADIAAVADGSNLKLTLSRE